MCLESYRRPLGSLLHLNDEIGMMQGCLEPEGGGPSRELMHDVSGVLE